MLESWCHDENCFVTLTYDDKNIHPDGTLVPDDLRFWLMRFRNAVKALEGKKVRYYAVGEYGENTWRPHYHLSLFGIGQAYGAVIQDTWGKGFTSTYEFNEKTAQYVAGYVLKKMTTPDDYRLDGRHPEFSRMSRRPGLGAPAMSVFADSILTDAGLNEFQAVGDVPMKFNVGRKSYPLGRYLRQKLREEIGVSETHQNLVKQAFFLEKSEEVQDLREAALARAKEGEKWIPIRKLVADQNKQAALNIEGKAKIWKKKETL